jgi:prepilin-type N-terminal cleavage/methylation domain-containing protein
MVETSRRTGASHRRRRAFTLTELLVAIAIILVAMSIILVVFSGAVKAVKALTG